MVHVSMEEQIQLADFRNIIRRRKKAFIIGFSIVFVLAVMVAFVLPPIYRSESTILIETQQIPSEYVRSSVTGYVEERLSVIEQRVMSHANLLEIINRFDLYPDMKDKYTTEDIVDKMREDISRNNLSAEVMDERTGRPTVATIAFELAYEGKDPSTVQKVAGMLASIYLEQNLQAREKRATGTTEFLQGERDQLNAEIARLQDKLSAFKNENAGALPEDAAMNQQSVIRIENDIDRADMETRSLEDRKVYLRGQLLGIDPLNPIVTEDGKTVMNPSERLKALRLELLTYRATFSDKHPDIIQLKKQIKELEAETGESEDAVEKIRMLNDFQGRLAALKAKLGTKHPDVVRFSKVVELLEKEVKDLKAEDVAAQIEGEKPDNPAYINLMTQLESVETQLKSLLEEKKKYKEKMERYLARMEKAPSVEKEYMDMLLDLESARQKYHEIMNRLMEAKIAQGMEEAQRGEKLTIINPAQLAEKPYKPNRLAIVLIGFVLATGTGVGIAAMQETTDSSVKSAVPLAEITGLPVFSTISFIETREERRKKQIKRWIWILTVASTIVFALFLIHTYYMPLDIAWIKIQRRLGIL